MHDCKPQSRLGHILRKNSSSPKHGFDLDNTNGRTPDVIKSSRANVLPRAFRYTHYSSNHYDLDSFPIRLAQVCD
jgi:hypothetical protein